MAFKNRKNPKYVIVHSDKGSQYRSHAFRKLISDHHCLYSYTSLNHSCDENANQESFHASLKKRMALSPIFQYFIGYSKGCFRIY